LTDTGTASLSGREASVKGAIGALSAVCVHLDREKEKVMALYMYQASYTSDAWKTQVQNPQNRAEQLRSFVEANGGKMLGFYYTFGEYDMVIITEFPDNVSASAVILAAISSGVVKSGKTTVLMSVEDGIEAMRKASGAGYRPPGS
jgi:uncharacterized protein with GYD domain